MTRALRLAAILVAVTLVAGACARSSAGTAASSNALYQSTIQLTDVAPLLGDSSKWWPAPPTFGVRPLNVATLADQERYEITVRFNHSGTPEGVEVLYVVWDSVVTATAVMDNTASALGASLSGPKAGDQVLYYNKQQQVGAAPYDSETLIRVGQTEVIMVWSQTLGFAATSQSGKIAARVVSRLRQGLALKSHPVPVIDPALLPPVGPDLTLLGAAELGVQATAALLDTPAPDALVKDFSILGVNDFVYGDFALNDDTRMEMRSAAYTFSDPAAATTWLSAAFGQSNLDSTGEFATFDAATEQYVAAFASGAHGAILICKSSARFEAASKACELPMSRVSGAWRAALSA